MSEHMPYPVDLLAWTGHRLINRTFWLKDSFCILSCILISSRTLLVEGLELQSSSYNPALFLVAGPVFFLCLPYFSQSELCGGVVIREHTLNQSKQLGLDRQHANKLARKLYAHSVMYANKLVTTRHDIENKNTSRSQAMEPGPITLLIPIKNFFLEQVETRIHSALAPSQE
eukprot:1140073-Pelagomonas_calceolata.AAC.1